MHVSGLPKLTAIEVISNRVIESIEIEASKLESLRNYLTTPCQITLLHAV
jgi:hypothetical protein